MDEEATHLILEATFHVKGMVSDIHRPYFEDEEPNAEEPEAEDS